MVEDNVKAQMRKGIHPGDPLAGGFLCSEDHRRTQGGGDDRGRRDAVSDPDAAEECGPAHLPVGRVPAGTAPQVLFPYGQGAGVPGFAG